MGSSEDGNNFYPGILPAHKDGAEDYTLTIKGDGSLTVSPFSHYEVNVKAAGIGAGTNIPCGNIVIEGGTINAIGGQYSGAGIGAGSGSTGSCGRITISGGTINANGGNNGAGIGGGDNNAMCDDIIISGGEINATGGSLIGAGIGAGNNGSCDGIIISGGTITAQGGPQGAGIGGGYQGSCNSIYISGGTITATGGSSSGAGIGGGNVSPVNSFITITSGVESVWAKKNSDNSYDENTDCIGRGYNCTCGPVTIGSTVYNGGDPYLKTKPLIYDP